jgi:uncharacterized protein
MDRIDPSKTIQRAYAVIKKSALELTPEGAIIRGTATTPTADRYGDTVQPLGAKFSLPLPQLWQHDASKPLGQVRKAAVTAEGIDFESFLPKPSKSSALIARYDEAVESVQLGLVLGVSIGFRSWDGGYVFDQNTYAFDFQQWEWLENSLVTIPANADAQLRTAARDMPLEALRFIARSMQYSPAATPGNAAPTVRLSDDDLRRFNRKQGAVYLK